MNRTGGFRYCGVIGGGGDINVRQVHERNIRLCVYHIRRVGIFTDRVLSLVGYHSVRHQRDITPGEMAADVHGASRPPATLQCVILN